MVQLDSEYSHLQEDWVLQDYKTHQSYQHFQQ